MIPPPPRRRQIPISSTGAIMEILRANPELKAEAKRIRLAMDHEATLALARRMRVKWLGLASATSMLLIMEDGWTNESLRKHMEETKERNAAPMR